MSTKIGIPPKSTRRKTTAKSKSRAPKVPNVVDDLAEILKVLADSWRLRILLALAEQGQMHVTAIKEFLDEAQPDITHSQPAVSHHLSLLRMYNLVGFRRDGKNNYYYVDGSKLRDLLEAFFSYTNNGQKLFHFPGFSLSYRSK